MRRKFEKERRWGREKEQGNRGESDGRTERGKR